MHQTSQSTHYWWCWVAIGELIAYILVMNAAIAVLLTILPRQPPGKQLPVPFDYSLWLADMCSAWHGYCLPYLDS